MPSSWTAMTWWGARWLRFASDAIYDVDIHPIPARGAGLQGPGRGRSARLIDPTLP